jgi:glycosyltransferase involved in cell wall biosynthesis
MTGNATHTNGAGRQGGVIAAIVPCYNPCYNAASTLAETLESVLVQECVAEAIVIDDGSTDKSLAVARAFEPAVRVLTGPNQGVSAAHNRGIAETTTPWLLFLDSDDLLTPHGSPHTIAVL